MTPNMFDGLWTGLVIFACVAAALLLGIGFLLGWVLT